MHGLHPDVASWLARALGPPTSAQTEAVPRILAGENVLVSSPTGSGKTLAAFLGVFSELVRLDEAGALGDGIRVVYVSPLKALARDVARNLVAPLEGVGRAERIRVAMRSGDTSPAERARMARRPPHVLVTTPESLALLVSSPRLRPALAGVRFVVVDEVHALLPTKRGAHLALTLERLEALAERPPQRVGLSATVRPVEAAARFLCGARPCLVVEVPRERPPRLEVGRVRDEEATVERAAGIVGAHRTTIVFTNTRASAERVSALLHERLGDEAGEGEAASVAPHHGSMSREDRHLVEARLQQSDLRCVVASSSLELGIHVDDVEAVVLLGSPKSSARALQRVGRSGHQVGGEPRGWLLAQDPDELLEAAAVAELAAEGRIEPASAPAGGLDVLAQHLLGLSLEGPVSVADALALVRRAWPYRDVRAADLDALLAHLAERRLVRLQGGRFEAASGRARMTYHMQAGTIPDAALLRVLDEGRYVGEVDEAFAETLEPGEVFRLAGRAWRFERALGRSVHVTAAHGRLATVPEWRAEGLAASPLVLEAVGDLLRRPPPFFRHATFDTADTEELLSRLLRAQRALLPEAPGLLLAEAPLDEEGRRALILHARLGRRANDALARALAPRLDEAVTTVATDLGLAFRGRRGWRPTEARVRALFEAPLDVPDLDESEVLLRRFRHVAQRGLLLPRSEAGLVQQQHEARSTLRRLLREAPDHPLLREARREALEDAMDLPAAEAFRRDVHDGRLRVRLVDAHAAPSPLGTSILHPRGARSRGELIRDAIDLAEAATRPTA